jgi:hypothetical protein
MKARKVMTTIALCAALAGLAGCVSTVTDESKAGVPFIKDSFTGQYERSVDQVFQAGKQVIQEMGALTKAGTLYDNGAEIKTLEGKVNQCDVWMRIEPAENKVTAVTVQVRTKNGGSNMPLAHELEKQLAVKLSASKS